MQPHMVAYWLIFALWCAWGIYWGVSALDVKATVREESLLSRLSHLLPLAVACWLDLTPRMPWKAMLVRLFEPSLFTDLIGIVVAAAGLAFSIWARRTLGRNWSGTVTLKTDHELIEAGPYRFARHPIYTGMLTGFVGWAIVIAEVRGIIAVALVAASFWRKLKIEERWMLETFGERYTRYRQRVAALVPFVL